MSSSDPRPAAAPTGDADVLIKLRRELHAHPELSGKEAGTAACLREFLLRCQPQRIIERLGGHGLAAMFAAPDAAGGPTLALRAELDALPIQEHNPLPYASRRTGVAHLCGHDGHMAMLCGLARSLRDSPLVRGRLVLLFQAAEETGKGASAVLTDQRWQQLQVDRIFALHNMPGYPLGEILLRAGAITAGSVGLVIRLQGRTAHAAYPEQGLSPAMAMSRLVPGLVTLPIDLEAQGHLALVTVVHASLGTVAFGTAPGEAEVMATLRSDNEAVLAELRRRAAALAVAEADRDGLACELAWVEEFSVTQNDPGAVEIARRAAQAAALPTAHPSESPFRWSEDLGRLTRAIPGALIGVGAGSEQPVLHAPDYDFPDALLPIGLRFYRALLAELGMG